ncbi:MlaD family protein [Tsukamurella sp. 8F]|uniref:MlaD family protein n=1 Tax=unclassified Tsukamurella TaxID=2633480 RepID=UPI0023BA3933|nr:MULTISPECIES: MlaD family protein [unclassified Tsukamurella]MDF0530746.1 MlaD family protein [Tsukamurella sp. 8J]MDF0587947.1 MlaD family protein [Tsukamurella sp. 8F]
MAQLLIGTPQRQHRVYMTVGIAAIVAIAVVALVFVGVRSIAGGDDRMPLTVSAPDVGAGVRAGTTVTMRGVPVGTVSAVAADGAGRVRVALRLDRADIAGLTDTFTVRYQPGNYFGVTELAIVPGEGGSPVRAGQVLRPEQSTDTISDLLNNSSVLVNSIITDRLVDVTRRATSYTQALTPLLELGFTLEQQVAATQKMRIGPQIALLRRTVDGVPGVVDAAFGSMVELLHIPLSADTVYNFTPIDKTTQLLGSGFFGPLGAMLGSHKDDFTPATLILRSVTDTATTVLGTVSISRQVIPLIDRLNHSFVTRNGKQALSVKMIVDRLPAAAAALGATTGNGR